MPKTLSGYAAWALLAIGPVVTGLAGCGGTTEESDTAVAVGPAGGGDVGAVAPGEDVPTEPVVGTGGSVVEAPEAPGDAPTIGIGTDAEPGTSVPAEGDASP